MNRLVTDDNTLVALGLIAKPRGLFGETKVIPYQPSTRSLRPGLPVVISARSGSFPTVITSVKQEKKHFYVSFQGIDSREAALAIKGAEIACRKSDIAACAEGEYYVFDLLGLAIVDQQGTVQGRIREILSLPANDVLVIDSVWGEVLVPFVSATIKKVLVADGIVVIDDLRRYIAHED